MDMRVDEEMKKGKVKFLKGRLKEMKQQMKSLEQDIDNFDATGVGVSVNSLNFNLKEILKSIKMIK
jgi:hypothetical protein